MLDAAGIPWRFTSTEYAGALGPMMELLECGALPSDKYADFIFERVDRCSEGDPHPGPKSHSLFADRIVEQLLMAGVGGQAHAR